MKFICQSVPYRHFGILRKFFHNRLVKSAVLYSVIHTCKHPCRICNAFFLADLGACRIQIGCSHTKIMCCHLKRTTCSCGCFFKDQCYILAMQAVMQLALFLHFLVFCCQIDQIQDLLRCIIKQFQKIASF